MISKVLVANRGEIARRVFRTCREMGIATVAIYSEPDSDAPHVHEADEAVLLHGATPTETYLNIEEVLAAAKETSANAIHPGYGFLSENPEFAQAVTAAGLVWIGPSPRSMEIMGSKLESKRLMEQSGVPVLPSVELEGISTVESAALAVGYPILIKASAGGGGKGMRIVSEPDDLRDAIDGARREAAASFGDDTVFIEKYLEAPRHIEIQVFGDTRGHVISLHERECSIQRRHQKIIEEAPSPGISRETADEIGAAAVNAARAVDYVGAGTVEFLYQDGRFYFLEMNTRLQVEHPVTEMVTGVDLVRLQIEIADGAPLPDHPPRLEGHAIEARLYAEDPLNDFLPVSGEFHSFEFPEVTGLRVDSGIENGSVVSVHYDPMIAKVIAHGPTRESAATVLASSLRRARIHGSITNRALLVRTLEHPEFLSGETDTHFLDRHDVSELGAPLLDANHELLAAVATALADQAAERSNAPVLTTIPSGWRNSPSTMQTRTYTGSHGEHEVSYSVAPEGFAVMGIGHVAMVDSTPDTVTLIVDDTEHHYSVARYGTARYVDSELGPAHLTEMPRFALSALEHDAGSLQAPMPGKVIKVDAEVGDLVDEGKILVVLEAMKMEHTLRSPHAGTVSEVYHQAGDQVDAHDVLVVVEEA